MERIGIGIEIGIGIVIFYRNRNRHRNRSKNWYRPITSLDVFILYVAGLQQVSKPNIYTDI